MAIYHHSTKVVSRRSGKSATGAAAYRSAEKIVDERTGIINDYTRKLGVEHTEILTPIPPGANTWLTDRAQLWNKVEQTEKRFDAQLAREINIAIPTELNRQDRIELVREYIQTSYVDRGMIADICFHDFQSNNPHAHIMLTMRELKTDQQGVISFGNKQREWNDRNLLTDHRREWAEIANKYLENAGYEVRIDHRSLVSQGITDRLPQIHLGANVAAMKERGIPTSRGDIYDQIAATNLEIKAQLERVYQAEKVLDVVEKIEAREEEDRQVERDKTLIAVGLAYPEARDADFHAALARSAERERQRQESIDNKAAKSALSPPHRQSIPDKIKTQIIEPISIDTEREIIQEIPNKQAETKQQLKNEPPQPQKLIGVKREQLREWREHALELNKPSEYIQRIDELIDHYRNPRTVKELVQPVAIWEIDYETMQSDRQLYQTNLAVQTIERELKAQPDRGQHYPTAGAVRQAYKQLNESNDPKRAEKMQQLEQLGNALNAAYPGGKHAPDDFRSPKVEISKSERQRLFIPAFTTAIDRPKPQPKPTQQPEQQLKQQQQHNRSRGRGMSL